MCDADGRPDRALSDTLVHVTLTGTVNITTLCSDTSVFDSFSPKKSDHSKLFKGGVI